jgi:dTDP-4-dehydrorhamnose reductase
MEVVGAVHRRRDVAPGCRAIAADLTDFAQLRRLLARCSPDAVIHTAAISSTTICEQSPAACRRINVEASVNLAGLCAERGARFVFTSSDQVFDGAGSWYREEDPVNPINAYGEQKARAEEEIHRVNPAAVVCRMPLLYGLAPPGAASVWQRTVAALRAGEAQRLFVDEFRTPLDAISAARGLLIALSAGEPVLHLGGAERLSRFDLGVRFARRAGVDPRLIEPVSRADSPMARTRPADVSLDGSLARGLGFAPARMEDALSRLEAPPAGESRGPR